MDLGYTWIDVSYLKKKYISSLFFKVYCFYKSHSNRTFSA